MGCQWGVLELYVECIGPVLIHIVQRHIYTNIYIYIYRERERYAVYVSVINKTYALFFRARCLESVGAAFIVHRACM